MFDMWKLTKACSNGLLSKFCKCPFIGWLRTSFTVDRGDRIIFVRVPGESWARIKFQPGHTVYLDESAWCLGRRLERTNWQRIPTVGNFRDCTKKFQSPWFNRHHFFCLVLVRAGPPKAGHPSFKSLQQLPPSTNKWGPKMSTPKSSVTSVFSGLEHGNATRMELNARGGIQSKSRRASRQLGDTEASYFWPSRENGVNDMCVLPAIFSPQSLQLGWHASRYLCVGITAPVHLFKQESTVLAWAILRLRHPLLASRVEMLSYDDVNFV